MENGKLPAFQTSIGMSNSEMKEMGLTKREYMATHILAGMMQSCKHEEEHLHYAIQAVAYADALLEALSKP